jgi:hypothetical protein
MIPSGFQKQVEMLIIYNIPDILKFFVPFFFLLHTGITVTSFNVLLNINHMYGNKFHLLKLLQVNVRPWPVINAADLRPPINGSKNYSSILSDVHVT